MNDKYFVEGCEHLREKGEGSDEILNWYRNLYYKEELNTERGIVAMALNDILPELVSLREKQTPKKPIKKNPICYAQTKDGTEFIAYDYFCPDCNKQIKATEHHCKCGQALDWSDTE